MRECLSKKRKGSSSHLQPELSGTLSGVGSSPLLLATGLHLSLEDRSHLRKKHKEQERVQVFVKNRLTCSDTSLACQGKKNAFVSDVIGRGHKRKLGCIESATQMGRKKKIEHDYVLGHEIGKGKFGVVRLCRSLVNNKEFACKTLVKHGEESVHREVEIMQHLSGHPGVVTLKAVYEDSEAFHLVMEFCSGGRLLDSMSKVGCYSEQQAATILKELILVIKYCHEMGVVHRDIKPENILLTATGKIKLADFGLATRLSTGQSLSGVAGSPAYVAPEVLMGHYSEKVDLWGAGVLLHGLLVGFLPFKGSTQDAIFDAIKTAKLDFQGEAWGSISDLARDLLGGMLTRDTSKRLTADEILNHPWILYHTDCDLKPQLFNRSKSSRKKDDSLGRHHITNPILVAATSLDSSSTSGTDVQHSSTCGSLSQDQGGFGLVDALAAAISRVRISEPKRSRLCGPTFPIQQECSSNIKSNLCTAF